MEKEQKTEVQDSKSQAQPAQGQAAQAPEKKDQEFVPKERLDELNNRLGLIQQQLLMYQNNPIQSAQQAPPQPPADPFAGIGEEDFIEGKTLKQLGKNVSEQIAGLKQVIQQLQFQIQNPETGSSVQKAIQVILQKKPELQFQLNTPQGKSILLGEMAKLAVQNIQSANPSTPGQPDISAAAQALIDAANRPQSAASVGGGGGAGSPDWGNMSREEFQKKRAEMGFRA